MEQPRAAQMPNELFDLCFGWAITFAAAAGALNRHVWFGIVAATLEAHVVQAAGPVRGECAGNAIWLARLAVRLPCLQLTSDLQCLQEADGTTLTLTGVLGLAAVVYALYQLRAGPGEPQAACRVG